MLLIMSSRNIHSISREGEQLVKQQVTKQDIAKTFKVSKRTVNNWMIRGLPHFRENANLVRFDPEAVEQWVKAHTLPAVGD